jgi:hypothetical protein
MQANETETNFIESVLDAGEVEVPPRQSQAHEGEITGVSIFEADSGAVAIQIDLTSLNTGAEDRFLAFVPELFVDNFLETIANPNTLPEEEGNNQRFSYRQNISNRDKSATMQVLTQIALNQGRGAVLEGVGKPQSFEEYVDIANKLLSGTQVIYRKRETKRDGRKFFGVTNYFSGPEEKNNPRAFKRGYVKMWELGE